MGERISEPEETIYLVVEDVIGLYADQFGCTEVEAVDQLRNRAGLEGALARPQAWAYYENADLACQAAALAHGIAESQCFVDGNKRVALTAMMLFLRANGHDVVALQPDRARWILDLSAGLTVEELGAKIRYVIRRRPN